jgi:hypothetical protein
MKQFPGWTAALICMAGVGAGDAALAQTARSGGAASAQLLQQVQQLASERTALQAESARLKSELDDTRKERDQLKKAQQGIEQRAKSTEAALTRSAAQRESTEQELTKLKAKMQELIGKFRETLQTLRETETQQTATQQTLAARDRDLKQCVDHNLALYKLNDEVLTRLERHGFWSRAAEAEPFMKIKRVELENLVDDYRSRALDQRVAPTTAAPAGGSPAPAPRPTTAGDKAPDKAP